MGHIGIYRVRIYPKPENLNLPVGGEGGGVEVDGVLVK